MSFDLESTIIKQQKIIDSLIDYIETLKEKVNEDDDSEYCADLECSLMREGVSNCFTEYTANRLKSSGIYFIGDVVRRTELDLVKIDKFGKKCLEDVKSYLRENGLSLKNEKQ